MTCFWSIEDEPTESLLPELVLPDGCPEIVFNLSDRFEKIDSSGRSETQAAAIVSGQLRSNILIRRTGRVSLFGIRFQPFGAYEFLGIPLSELTDAVVPLDTVIGRRCVELEQKIGSAADFQTRVAAAERELASISPHTRAPQILQPMISEIQSSLGRKTVGDLRHAYGLSERQLQREFARRVGVSPKTFSRIVRFQNLVRRIERSADPNLLESALELGYYDQSHMIREFNEFAGKSPLFYFRETHRLSDLFTGAA